MSNLTTCFLKPATETSARYRPGRSRPTLYPPDASVTILRSNFPVCSLYTATVAPDMTAPDVSFTMPATPPDSPLCANEPTGVMRDKDSKAKRQDKTTATRLLTIQLPPGEAGVAPRTWHTLTRTNTLKALRWNLKLPHSVTHK